MAKRKKAEPDPITETPVAVEQVVDVAVVALEAIADAPTDTPVETPETLAVTSAGQSNPIATAETLLASLPFGSRVEFTRGDPDRFVVYRGAGVAQHGEGKTLARALRTVGAKYEHALDENGKQTPRMVLLDEAGDVIPPEA